MSVAAIKLKGREIGPHKAVIDPLLTSRNVLTNSPWTFVALWLKRNRKQRALFYWEQAEEFHKASLGLPLRAAPLLLYYCFMNATKALLVAKGVSFDEWHGVSAYPKVVAGAKRTFAGEGVKIHTKGILPSLSHYYGEAEPSTTHTLQELFFNMVLCTELTASPTQVRRKCFCPWQTAATCTTRALRRCSSKPILQTTFPFVGR
jgi:hypothetical protein